MHTDNLIINNSRAWQTIERVAKLFPNFNAVTTTAFIIKSVYTVDPRTFMVSSENEEIFGVLDFVGKEEADYLDRLFSTVNIISKKEVVRLWVAIQNGEVR